MPVFVPGDFNHDGRVDGADLGILLANFGGPGQGDINGDGEVDGADMGLLLAAWDRLKPSIALFPAAPASAGAVFFGRYL